MNDHYHLHMIYNAYCYHTNITPKYCNELLENIVQKVGMRVMMGPYSDNCVAENNEGVTGIIVLETSHAAFHFWPEEMTPEGKGRVSFCLYSCRLYDYNKIIKYLQSIFPLVGDNDVDKENNWSMVIVDRTNISQMSIEAVHRTQANIKAIVGM